MGVKIKIAGPTSINIPTNNRTTFTNNRIKYLLSVIPKIAVLIASGIPVKAIAKDIIEEVANKNIMVPLIKTASFNILGKSFFFTVL